MIGFIPQGELKTDSVRPPLASRYKVLLPASLAELKTDPKFTDFLNIFLRSTATHADTIHYVNDQTVEDHSKGRYGSQTINFITLSQYFSVNLIKEGFFKDGKGSTLLEKLNGASIDVASAWVSVPDPNENNFPDLWKAKVFDEQKDLEDYLRYRWGVAARLPQIRISFSQKERLLPKGYDTDGFKDFLLKTAIPGLVNENTFTLVLETQLPDWYGKSEQRKPLPLSEWEKKAGWPNATYAVDAGANNWPSPILVVDSEDSVRNTHLKYLKDWVARFKGSKTNVTLPSKKDLASLEKTNTDYVYQRLSEEWRKKGKLTNQHIICSPLLMATGAGVSDEVVSGPNVSKYGLLAILPERTPLVYKKMFAYVLKEYSGLEALDYYTVGKGERALLSFNFFENNGHVQSQQDLEILHGFENWVKNTQLTFHSPTEDDLKRVGMATDYYSG